MVQGLNRLQLRILQNGEREAKLYKEKKRLEKELKKKQEIELKAKLDAEKKTKEQQAAEKLKLEADKKAKEAAKKSKLSNLLDVRNNALSTSRNASTSQRTAEPQALKQKVNVPSWQETLDRFGVKKEQNVPHTFTEEGMKDALTPRKVYTKKGIKFKSPIQMRVEANQYANDYVNDKYGEDIDKLDTEISNANEMAAGAARAGSPMASRYQDQSRLLLEQKRQLLEQAKQDKLDLLDKIDPNSQISDIFNTFAVDPKSNYGQKLLEKRNAIIAAADRFNNIYGLMEEDQKKQKELGVSHPLSYYEGTELGKQLSQAASIELNAKRDFKRETDKMYQLDQYIKAFGYPSDPSLLPDNIRKIAEEILPGSTSKESADLLLTGSYVDNKDAEAAKLDKKKELEQLRAGAKPNVTQDQLDSVISNLEHKLKVAEWAAAGDERLKDVENLMGLDGNTGLFGDDAHSKAIRALSKANDESYGFYKKSIEKLKEAKEYELLSKDALKGNWYNLNPFDDTKNTIGMGVWNSISKKNFWDGGASDLLEALDMKGISDKLNSGLKLTEGEQDYLDALSIDAIMLNNHGQFREAGGFKAGEVTATSLKFMADFILSKNILGAVEKAGIKATAKGIEKSAMSKFASFLLGNREGSLLEKEAYKAIEKYGEKGVLRNITRFLAKTPDFGMKVLGDASYALALSNTLQATKTASDVINLHTGVVDYTTDEEGNVHGVGFKDGMDWSNAIYTGEGRAFVENFSEQMGEWGIGHLLGRMGVRSFAGAAGIKSYKALREGGRTLIGSVTDLITKIAPKNWLKYVGEFLKGDTQINQLIKQGEYHGLFGEMAEEYYGMALEHALGVSDSKNNLWGDLTDINNFYDIFGGIALSLVFLGSLSSAKYGYHAMKYNRAKLSALNVFGDRWNGIEKALTLSSSDNMGRVMASMMGALTDEKEKKTLFNYYNALNGYRGASYAELENVFHRDRSAHQTSVEEAEKSGYYAGNIQARKDLNRAIEAMDSKIAQDLDLNEYGVASVRDLMDQYGGVENLISEMTDLTQELKNQLYAFDNMIAAQDGMNQRVSDDQNALIEEQNKHINWLTHSNGNVVKVVYKDKEGKEHEAFLTKGNFKKKDGKLDLENTDKEVTVTDFDEKRQVINASDITKIVAERSAKDIQASSMLEVILSFLELQLNIEKNTGIAPGDTHKLSNGGTLTILGSSRDGGILYSVSDGLKETIGHESNPQSMSKLIKDIEDGRINAIQERAVEQSKNDDNQIHLSEDEGANEEDIEEKIAEQEADTLNDISSFIPSTTKKGKTVNSKTAFNKVKDIAKHVKSSSTFEDFIANLHRNGINIDDKHKERLKKLFNALRKGTITPNLIALTFVSESERNNKEFVGIDTNFSVNEDGEVFIPKKRKSYVSPNVEETESQNASEERLNEIIDQFLSESTGELSDKFDYEEDESEESEESEETESLVATSPEYMFDDDFTFIEESSEPESDEEGAADAVNNTENPNAQLEAIDKLLEHLKKALSEVLIEKRTGNDYFIKINGKLVMFPRVHSVLDPTYKQSSYNEGLERIERNKIQNAYTTGGIDGLEQYVKNHPKYDSSLDVYFEYLRENPEENGEVLQALGNILSRTKPGISVDYGNLLDFLSRKGLENINQMNYETMVTDNGIVIKDAMSKETFDKIVNHIKALKEVYDRLHWKVFTTPHTFYTEVYDNKTGKTRRIAGETDAIAVDEQGKYHIIDFKTSYKQYTTELDESNPLFYVDPKFTRTGSKLIISQGLNYTDLLTIYDLLISDNLGGEVASIELVPWKLNYQWDDPEVHLQDASNNPQRISLNINKGLLDRFNKPTVGETEKGNSELRDQFNQLRDVLNNTLSDLNDKNLDDFSSGLRTRIELFKLKAESILNYDYSESTDDDLLNYQNLILQLLQEYDLLNFDINEQETENQKAESELEEYQNSFENEQHPSEEPLLPTVSAVDTNTSINNKNTGYTGTTFNETSGESVGISDAVAEDDSTIKLADMTTRPDFILNAKFEFIMKTVTNARGKTNNKVHVVVTYNGHKFLPVALLIDGTPEGAKFYKNVMNAFKTKTKDQIIVPIKVSRSNGLIIRESSKSAIEAGLISTERNGAGTYIYDIEYSDNQDQFGITKLYIVPNVGSYVRAECPGHVLHDYSEETRLQSIENGSHGITPGTIVMMVTRNFMETNDRVKVPVTFLNAKLTEGDADLIISILQGKYGALDDEHVESGKALGLTNRDIINMFIPTFWDRSTEDNPLHFEIEESGIFTSGSYKIGNIVLKGNIQGQPSTSNTFRVDSQDAIDNFKSFLMNNVRRNIDLNIASSRLGQADDLNTTNQLNPFHRLAKKRKSLSGRNMFDNGPILLENSTIIFDPSDFKDPNNENDEKGLSGLGWYIKHGFLETEFGGFKNALLNFNGQIGIEVRDKDSLVTIPTTPEASKKTIEETKEPTIDELMKKAGLNSEHRSINGKPLNKEVAKKRLTKIFGENGVATMFIDHAIAMLKSGAQVVGRCYKDAIVLSSLAELGVEWHEAFHRVVDLLLSTKEREKVYKAYRNAKKGRKNMTESEIREGLSDEFWYYMDNRPTFKLSWNIKSMFRLAADWVNMLRSIGSIRLFMLYEQTNSGRFRNIQPTEEAKERFEKIASDGLNYEVNGVDIKGIGNVHQLKDLVKSLTYILINERTLDIHWDGTNVQDLKVDVETLKNSPVYQELLSATEGHPTHDLLIEAVEKYDSLLKLVASAVSEFTTDFKEVVEKVNDEMRNGNDTESTEGETDKDSELEMADAGIAEHTRASYEFSQFSRTSQAVRFFFSGISTVLLNSLGLPELYSVKYTFNSALNELHGCKTPEQLALKLAELGKLIPMFLVLAQRYLKLYVKAWGSFSGKKLLDADAEGLLTLIFNMVCTNKNVFKIIQSHEFGTKWTHDVKSTDQSYVANQHVLNWSRQFAAGASKYVKTGNDGKLTMKNGFAPKIFKKLYYFLAGNLNTVKFLRDQSGNLRPLDQDTMLGLIYAFYDTSDSENKPKFKINGKEVDINQPEGIETVKKTFISFLNSMGIVFNRDMLDYMLFHKYGQVGTEGLRKLFSPSSDKTSFESFAKFINGFYNPNGKLNLDETGTKLNGVDIDKIFNNVGFVKELANYEYEYTHSHEQLSVIGTGNNKMFTISENNTITDRIDELHDDDEFLSKMKGVLFNMADGFGSIILKSIKKGGPRMQFVTHSGFKTDKIGDSGSDYDNINKREDYISKMTVLLNGSILLPTMSDKKTYGWIEGINTIGINWNSSSITVLDVMKGFPTIDERGEVVYQFNDDIVEQMLEYAYTENKAIRHTLDVQNTATKISNFFKGSKIKASNGTFTTINGARYSGLLGVYNPNSKYADENGYVSFNRTLKADGTYLSEEECYQIAQEAFFNLDDKALKLMIRKNLTNLLVKEMDYLSKIGLIKKRVVKGSIKSPIYGYDNEGIDEAKVEAVEKAIVSTLKPEQKGSENLAKCRSLALATVIGDSVVRSIQSMQEFERCFSGAPGYYKFKWDNNGNLIDRTADQSKRFGGLVSTGANNNLSIPGIDENAEYTCTEIANEFVQSQLAKDIEDLMYKGSIRKTYFSAIMKKNYVSIENSYNDKIDFGEELGELTLEELEDKVNQMTDEEVEEALKKMPNGETALDTAKRIAKLKSDAFKKNDSQKGIDVADGASYMSDVMCENLLRMVGSYSKDVQTAFKILRGEKVKGKVYSSKDIIAISNAYKLVMTKVIGAQKYTAYGFRFLDGLAVPYYHKMALFPVFKVMSTGHMANIYKLMKDQKIDQLLINSSVKIGNEGTKDINWEECENGTFKFNTFKCKYKNLRKQFNTDPKEAELMAVKTLMTKVVMSLIKPGRSYKVNGKRVNGKALRNDIMKHLNDLSDLGKKEIEEKFFENGELNVDKFSKVLIEELSSRGADSQLLDAVRVEKRNGKKLLNIPLAAQSSVNWIQSIIVSMINKKIVDINTPGEAFIQRSIWGMEGPTNVIGDTDLPNSINGGEKLKMINEEGSMDCVLSLDYFSDILNNVKVKKTKTKVSQEWVTENKYGVSQQVLKDVEHTEEVEVKLSHLSFEEQKQWLIDHNIIGQGAKANIISYRVPTQAVSSIHPLRCVDVLPVVRHTVMLPEEFTKITGSDFDIDKVYLTRKFINEEGSTDFEKDSYEWHVNQLLDDYIGLLCDKDWQTDALNGSIDNDTELLTDIVEDLESGKVNPELRSYDPYTLRFLNGVRNEFSTGKVGIGPFALNNNSHVLAMLYNLSFKTTKKGNSIMERLHATRLDLENDRYGNAILSWLSGLINAHVDVAKDSYISRLNVNKYTYNLTNLLVRTGFGKTTFYYMTLPIMLLLADAYNNVTGKYMIDTTKMNTTDRVRFAEHSVVVNVINSVLGKAYVVNTDKKIDEYDKALEDYKSTTNINLDNLVESLFHKDNDTLHRLAKIYNGVKDINATDKVNVELLDGVDKETGKPKFKTVSMRMADVQIACAYANEQFKPYAEAISSLVKYTKIDTKKQGKNLAEQLAYMEGYRQLFGNEDERTIGNYFEQSSLLNLSRYSFIQTKTDNAITTLLKILGEQLLDGTKPFIRNVRYIMAKLGLDLTNKNYEIVSKLYNAKIKSEYFFGENGYCKRNNIDAKGLICGNNTIYDRLLTIKAKLLSEPEYQNPEDGLIDSSGNPTNYLLKTLVNGVTDTNPELYNVVKGALPSTYAGAKFVRVLNYMNDDEISKDEFKDAWLQLLEDKKHPELQQFARDLVVYAFITSADNGGKYDLFKYVPNQWKLNPDETGFDNSYVKYMSDKLEEFKTVKDTISHDDYEDIVLNNWFDNRFVPTVSLDNYTTWATDPSSGYPVVMVGISTNNGLKSVTSNDGDYIKVKRPIKGLKGQRGYTVYKYIGDGITTIKVRTKNGLIKDEKQYYPVYVQVDPRGDKIQDCTINEMSRNDRGTDSESALNILRTNLNDFLEKRGYKFSPSFEVCIKNMIDYMIKTEDNDISKIMLESKIDPVVAATIKGMYEVLRNEYISQEDEEKEEWWNGNIHYTDLGPANTVTKELYGNDPNVYIEETESGPRYIRAVDEYTNRTNNTISSNNKYNTKATGNRINIGESVKKFITERVTKLKFNANSMFGKQESVTFDYSFNKEESKAIIEFLNNVKFENFDGFSYIPYSEYKLYYEKEVYKDIFDLIVFIYNDWHGEDELTYDKQHKSMKISNSEKLLYDLAKVSDNLANLVKDFLFTDYDGVDLNSSYLSEYLADAFTYYGKFVYDDSRQLSFFNDSNEFDDDVMNRCKGK